jgi:type IV secretion system protein TrbG
MHRWISCLLALFAPAVLAAQTNPVDLLKDLTAQAQSTTDTQAPPQAPAATPDTQEPASAGLTVPFPRTSPPERERSRPASADPPKVLYDSDKVRYPFGYGRPLVRCVPLIACEIELEEGELITGFAVGDSDRWILDKFESGRPEHRRRHVVVKPTEWGVGTNLLIATDRRVYSLDLIAPARPKTEEKDFSYTHVAFYYPDDLLAEREERAARDAERQRQAVGTIHLADLHLDYRIAGSTRLPWRPLRVFDDGSRTFIQFPATLRSGDVPALLGVSADGETTSVLNYRRSEDGLYYVVDGTFPRARLLVQDGRKRTAAIDIIREN